MKAICLNRANKNFRDSINNSYYHCLNSALLLFSSDTKYDEAASRAVDAILSIKSELRGEQNFGCDFETQSLVTWLKADGMIFALLLCEQKRYLQYLLIQGDWRLKRSTLQKLFETNRKLRRELTKRSINHRPFLEINKTQKKLKNDLSDIKKKRLLEKKLEKYGSIKLSSLNLSFFLPFFTFIVLSASYYYNSQIFSYLNITTDGVLTASDYLYSSITFMVNLLISCSVVIFFMLLGLNDLIDEEIEREKFSAKSPPSPDKIVDRLAVLIIFGNLISFAMLLVSFEIGFEMVQKLAFLNSLIFAIFLLVKIPFHYFSSPTKIYFSCLVLLFFVWTLIASTNEEVEALERGEFDVLYTVETKSGSVNEKVIKITEKYVIVLTDNNTGMLIPLSEVIKIQSVAP